MVSIQYEPLEIEHELAVGLDREYRERLADEGFV